MYDVWYNVLTQKNWTCTSELMQDPLSKQLRKECLHSQECLRLPPSSESLGTKNTDRHDSISALHRLYAAKICLLKDGTMIYCTTSRTYRQTLTQKSYFTAPVTACTAAQRKAVATW